MRSSIGSNPPALNLNNLLHDAPAPTLTQAQASITISTLSVCLGNLTTIFIIGTLYLNYLIFLPHLPVLLVSYVMSSVLRRHKSYILILLKGLDEDEETKSSTITVFLLKQMSNLHNYASLQSCRNILISQPYLLFISITCLKLSANYFFKEFLIFGLTASIIIISSFSFFKVKISAIYHYRYFFTDDSFSTFLSLSFMLFAVLFTVTVLTTQCVYEMALTVKGRSKDASDQLQCHL